MSLTAFLFALFVTIVNFTIAAIAINRLPIDRRYKTAAMTFVAVVLLTWLVSGTYLYLYGWRPGELP